MVDSQGDLAVTAGDGTDEGAAAGTEVRPAASAVWSEADEADLMRAVAALERSSFANRIGALLGRQIGFVGDLIPADVSNIANAAAAKALTYALKAALATMPKASHPLSARWHIAAVAASGALGGALGLATLPIELPVSTTLMLRSIAGIAREEGEDLDDAAANVACLEVFGLGAGTDREPLGQSGYFAARTLMAKSVSEAARYMVQRGMIEESAPAVLRLVAQIASRFGLVVTQKVVAQAVPVLGAATGAAVNAAFMDHYQSLARGHFIVRRLERRYGADAVRAAYERLSRAMKSGAAGATAPRPADIPPVPSSAALPGA